MNGAIEQLELPLLIWGPPGTELHRIYMRRYMRMHRAGRRVGRKAHRHPLRPRPGYCADCGHAWPLEAACSMCALPKHPSAPQQEHAWRQLIEVLQ